MANKTGKGGFNKGKSGNPGGRPKANIEVKAAIQERGQEMVDRLFELMASEDERIALGATGELFDRGYGKAPQSMNVKSRITDDRDETNDNEAIQAARRRIEHVAANGVEEGSAGSKLN